MIKSIRIENYKSIYQLEIELGRFNVFIGENGSGKTNILEAIAMLTGAQNNRLTIEDLSNQGVRVAIPKQTFSSFLSRDSKEEITFKVEFEDAQSKSNHTIKSKIACKQPNDLYSKWYDNTSSEKIGSFVEFVSDYVIYNLDSQALRGITHESKKTPLGIHGERLDMAIYHLDDSEKEKLYQYKYLINWLEEIKLDKDKELKSQSLNLEGQSILYFSDKFMKKDTFFNIENANEGILHILHYLTLFISKNTPSFFAIDNIETALNPQLCRHLTEKLSTISQSKQALITTHNPAILDGLNLMDDGIRLFEVKRNNSGETKCKRIQFRKGIDIKQYKLSEMWLKGLLGAVPQNF